jgi:hypothetical protein
LNVPLHCRNRSDRNGARALRNSCRQSDTGRSFRCTDHGHATSSLGNFRLSSPFEKHYQVGGPPRGLKFWRDRRQGEAFNRKMHEALRKSWSHVLERFAGASAEALEILDLQPPFTRADVERAFKAKAQKVHPDKGGDDAIMRALLLARKTCLNEATG